MNIVSVEKIINFDNGDSFKVGERVKVKAFNKNEMIATIDDVSAIYSGIYGN